LQKAVVRSRQIARYIFGLYLEEQALLLVTQELARRGWLNKRWLTRKGQVRVGFDGEPALQHLQRAAHRG